VVFQGYYVFNLTIALRFMIAGEPYTGAAAGQLLQPVGSGYLCQRSFADSFFRQAPRQCLSDFSVQLGILRNGPLTGAEIVTHMFNAPTSRPLLRKTNLDE
jgi:hypothetical protein